MKEGFSSIDRERGIFAAVGRIIRSSLRALWCAHNPKLALGAQNNQDDARRFCRGGAESFVPHCATKKRPQGLSPRGLGQNPHFWGHEIKILFQSVQWLLRFKIKRDFGELVHNLQGFHRDGRDLQDEVDDVA